MSLQEEVSEGFVPITMNTGIIGLDNKYFVFIEELLYTDEQPGGIPQCF